MTERYEVAAEMGNAQTRAEHQPRKSSCAPISHQLSRSEWLHNTAAANRDEQLDEANGQIGDLEDKVVALEATLASAQEEAAAAAAAAATVATAAATTAELGDAEKTNQVQYLGSSSRGGGGADAPAEHSALALLATAKALRARQLRIINMFVSIVESDFLWTYSC